MSQPADVDQTPVATTCPAPASAFVRHARRAVPATAALAAVSLGLAPHAQSAVHTVTPGETVSQIALTLGSTTAAIISANGLDSHARIQAGQTLDVPSASGRSTARKASKSQRRTTPKTRTHRVVPGDTVSGIALHYGSTVSSIIAANGLDSRALIRIGERLQVPAAQGSRGQSSHASKAPRTTTKAPSSLVGNTFAGRTYASSIVAAANENKATLEANPAPSRAVARQLIRDAARRHGVDPALALAIAHQESGFNQRAVSPANAVGIMQVTPIAGDWAHMLSGKELNLLVAAENVEAGVTILARLVATSTDLEHAVASYYQGQTSVRKYGMFTDTRGYVRSVLALAAGY